MSDLDNLKAELARLDPMTETGGTLSKGIDWGAAVYWAESDDDTTGLREGALEFSVEKIPKLVEVLRLLPTGCAVAEGDDGSLWEVLIDADDQGVASARLYAIEHHGGGS
jgi:hypothetical protein